jgi:hypothetical protein
MLSPEVVLNGTALAEEMAVDINDKRRTKRAQAIVEAISEKPSESFPNIFANDVELEGFYRFVGNPNIGFKDLCSSHIEHTAQRCEKIGKVLAIHDTTEFAFPVWDDYIRENLSRFSRARQGYYAHMTIAASADGLRASLGALGVRPYVHSANADIATQEFWNKNFGEMEKESDRWIDSILSTEEVLQDVEEVIHVGDRELDIYEAFANMLFIRCQYIIRAAQDRNVLVKEQPEISKLFDAVSRQPLLTMRTIKLSPRRHSKTPPAVRKAYPSRRERSARLEFRAVTVDVKRPRNRPDLQDYPESIEMNVVEAREIDTPEGEEPVHWVLLTTEPIGTEEDVLLVVDLYRTRWLIEEFFKAIKTGCAYPKRQLDSASTLLLALALTLPVAWKLLVMRHFERQCPDVPADTVITCIQYLCLCAALPKWKWSDEPTVAEACRAIASLGGHLKSNGRPGWLTISRGYRKLLEMEVGWNAAMKAMEDGLRN